MGERIEWRCWMLLNLVQRNVNVEASTSVKPNMIEVGFAKIRPKLASLVTMDGEVEHTASTETRGVGLL